MKWEADMQKISMTKLLQSKAGLSLDVAKKITDDILDDKQPSVTVENYTVARFIVDAARELGVIGELR